MKQNDAIILDRHWIEGEIAIEELEQASSPTMSREARIRTLTQLLIKSKPLLPYTEKCFDAGVKLGYTGYSEDTQTFKAMKQEFLDTEI